MPWCAISARPILRLPAPVKAPFSWPNSSFSSSVSGMAAQLMATNGPLARSESWCSERAISSLPVPLSPRSSTVASVAAARWMDSIVSLSAGSSPSSLGSPNAPLVFLLEQHVLGEQPAAVDGAVEEDHEVVGVHGLGQEVGGALLHRAHRLVDGAEGGHHHHRHVRVRLLRRLQHVEAAARGQPQVGQDDEVAGGRRAAASPRRRRPPPRRSSRGPRGSCAA